MNDHYKHNKTWRLKHPQKRLEGKLRYYRKTQNAKNKGNRWAEWEVELVMKHEMSDMELSKELGRSVQAIQARRYYINKRRGEQNA